MAPISFVFCNNDGTICKTPKSVVTDELQLHQTEITDPPQADTHIFDGFQLLHTLKNLPGSYGKIAKYVFNFLVCKSKEIHIIFDSYKSPSVRDFNKNLTGEEEIQYDIRKETKRPAEFSKLRRCSNFKTNFVNFLIEDWKSDDHVPLCLGKVVKLNFDKCYVYKISIENKMKRTNDYELSCSHDESCTKIAYHICQFRSNYRVQIHCATSDIPVIILTNFKYLKDKIEIIINLNINKKSILININEFFSNLGETLARSLAICHIFTGIDYNPAFYRRGENRPFAILKTETNFQEAFLKCLRTIQCK